MAEDYIKKFVEHLGKSLVADLKVAIPKHLETLLEVRFKGIKDGLESIQHIEATQRDQANMLENLQLSYKHLNEEFESFRKKSQNLPHELKETIQNSMEKGQEQILDTIATELEQIPTKPAQPVTPSRKKMFFFF